MASSAKRLKLSLEPIPIVHDDGIDDIFARPPRLLDINLEDGTEIYTRSVPLPGHLLSPTDEHRVNRDDPKKSISERLKRIWAERGDFSVLTAESILVPPVVEDAMDEEDTRPSPLEMREMQAQLMDQLSYVHACRDLLGRRELIRWF